jgi:hypothetical protein
MKEMFVSRTHVKPTPVRWLSSDVAGLSAEAWRFGPEGEPPVDLLVHNLRHFGFDVDSPDLSLHLPLGSEGQ